MESIVDILPAPFGPFSVVAVDLYGDGRQDVAAASGEGAGSLATWHGFADGSFPAPTPPARAGRSPGDSC